MALREGLAAAACSRGRAPFSSRKREASSRIGTCILTSANPLVSAMEELIVELRLFLELLDHEYLTSTVREKKAVITDILLRIQASRGACPQPTHPRSLALLEPHPFLKRSPLFGHGVRLIRKLSLKVSLYARCSL